MASNNDLQDHRKIGSTGSDDASSSSTAVTKTTEFQPYRLSATRVLANFHTDGTQGLTTSQVEESFRQYGANTLGEADSISYTKILAHQTFNAMIMVLIISMVIALAIQDWISGGVIAAVVVINIGIGFYQEMKAEKTMGSLRSLSSPTARVTRNGDDLTIATEEVVPGDLVHVKVGDTIPADLRLIDIMNLETDEALLTGESLPVAKNANDVYTDSVPVPVGDRLNMVFSSSVVSKGRGSGVAVSTGLDTEIGKIAQSLKSNTGLIRKVDKTDGRKPSSKEYTHAVFGTMKDIIGNFLGVSQGTPLQKTLSWLAIELFWIAVIFAIVVMASQKFDVTKEVAIYAISVALAMIPSALIVVLTVTMAVGAQVMVTKNVIVRKLDSLEALGGIDDICSDKTGTLTQGKMIAKKVWVPSVGTFAMDNINEPFNPTVGDLSHTKFSPHFISETDEEVDFKPLERQNAVSFAKNFKNWINVATLANIATVSESKDETSGELVWKAHGDATEIAIQVFCCRLGYARDEIAQGFEHIEEFPFDSSIKRMTAVYKMNDRTKIFTKGAVERILERCTRWTGNTEELTDTSELISMTDEHRKEIEDNMNSLSTQGLRVLAFASRDFVDGKDDLKDRSSIETDLTFHGLVGIYDPPRLETAHSVKLCHKAGINVHMVTGDHPSTAKAIAQEVGIIPSNLYHYSEDVVKAMCMTATDFDALTDEQIDALPVLPLVIARCAPQTKVRMIEALHRRDKYCAMTGDGVNDSPSLKKADVGIAMGLNGSDVAKDASDIVLTDDNFSSILNAIEEGRRMAANIQKFILQLLAENVAQAFYLVVGLAFKDKSGFSVFPLSPVEVLWVLLVTSSFPAMGLGQEQAVDGILEQPPTRRVFTKELLADMMAYGIWMAACCMLGFTMVVFAVGDGDLGLGCNSTGADLDLCNLAFRGRSTSFAIMTWGALILAWECIHPDNSLFHMRQETDNPWWKQTAIDLWANQFLFWSVIGGFVSVFPVVYIPVINDKVFLHAPIGQEWGFAFAFSLLYLAGCEMWKWMKRIYKRRRNLKAKAKNPEYDLERTDNFEKYASFSRNNTVDPEMLK
ncbi:P-type ATPase 2 [Metschnikowia bicuspidata var. bicuspidata NRRL YB-4993]|uniref:P-type Na(+) transporter n=1 Tax=Metschnikowia bicuspidata var. bicuspidata NRRL YB-4993 TaxID=869754 RepID=A0A1A0HDS1_9ASCO|nr:P-type ATPase 2 [Metschnikowia bicuspidata var. bicuspidata NRRL YB-4993]OBA22042.1 P-type ATPase 2 [Metschnikowia bicuspidata var. bicuspidata NRRL YB-4993]